MQRFLHPLAFFAAVLLMVGFLITLLINGLANAVICLDGCSSNVSELRMRLALVCLGPGLLLSVVAWDLVVTSHALRRSWRACALLLGIPVAVWVAVLIFAPAIPTVGVSGLDDARANGLLTALEAGAFTLWGLMCFIFVGPAPLISVGAAHWRDARPS